VIGRFWKPEFTRTRWKFCWLLAGLVEAVPRATLLVALVAVAALAVFFPQRLWSRLPRGTLSLSALAEVANQTEV
jgi:hypothetical protein